MSPTFKEALNMLKKRITRMFRLFFSFLWRVKTNLTERSLAYLGIVSKRSPIMQSNTKPSPVITQPNHETELEKTKRRSGTSGEIGVMYEKKILMLGLYRALKGGYDFTLDTNIQGAAAFDDVVFTYKESDGIQHRIYLQAKHKERENQKITYDELLMPANKNCILYKYFINYLETVRNLKKIKNKYFMIYTNIDFQCPPVDDKGLRIHKKSDNDYFLFRKIDTSSHRPLEILSTESKKANKKPAFFQFDINDEYKKDRVINVLKSNFKIIDGKVKDPKIKTINENELESMLKGYLDALILAVDQLNEEMLGNQIKDEIQQDHLGTLTGDQVDFIFQYALHKIGQWKNLSKAKPLSKINDFFKQGEEKIENCLALYPTLIYENELGSSDIRFNKEKFIKLNNFISSGEKLWHIFSNTSWLHSLLIYQALSEESLKENTGINYSDLDHHLFLTWSDLDKGRDLILPAFEKMKQSLLIIACESTDSKNNVIVDEIVKIVSASESGLKQVIVIAPENYEASKQLRQKLTSFYGEEYKIEFSDLCPESQKMCLTTEKIRFQGKDMLISIQQLLDLKQFTEPDEAFNKLNFDPSELEILLKRPIVEIGSENLKLSYIESAHYKTLTYIEVEQLKRSLKKCVNPTEDAGDIFAIAGDENDVKSLLPSGLRQELFRFENWTFPVVNGNFVLLKVGQEEEQFMQLCFQVHEAETRAALPALHLLEKKKEGWVWTRTYSRDFYIQRHFYPVIVNKEEIKDEIVKESPSIGFIIFSGTNEKELLKLLKIKKEDEIETFRENTEVFLREVAAQEVFDRRDIEMGQNRKSMHWLKINDQKQFQWCRSRGEVSSLRKLLINEEAVKTPLKEASVAKFKERVVVLADEPGMGKTTTLACIAELMRKEKPQSWVIKIDLNQHQEVLASRKIETVEELVNLLSNIDKKLDNQLTRRLLIYQLTCPENVILLFDGFDEVKSERQDAILIFFEFLKEKTLATLWVTTRKHDQRKLEDKLSVLAMPFKPLSKGEQIDFLIRFWTMALKLTVVNLDIPYIKNYAKDVIEGFEQSIKTNQNDAFLISIPLRARMLAETYLEKALLETKSSSEFLKIVGQFTIETLYQHFIDKKYDIYLQEKAMIGEGVDEDSIRNLKINYTKAYGLLAIKKLFDPQKYQHFIKNKKIKYSFNNLSRIGLIQGNEEPVSFIHQTFAEYFAAEWLAEKVQNSKVKEFLGNQLFKCGSGVIRRFFDDFITRNSPLHRAVLKGDMSVFQEFLQNNSDTDMTDGLGRTALHLAAQAGRSEMIQCLQNTVADKLARDKTGKRALHYAACFGYGEIIEQLLEYDIDIDDHILRTPLHFDAEIGNSIFNKPEYARSRLVSLLNDQDEAGRTPLYYAADNELWDTACSLLLYGADCSVLSAEQKRKLLRFAVNETLGVYGNQEHRLRPIVGFLSIQVPEAVEGLDDDKDYPRLLSYFFEHGHTKVVDVLLRSIENIERRIKIANQEDNSYSPLSRISNISYGNVITDSDCLKIVKYIFEQGSDLGIKIHTEEVGRLLSKAANHGFLETFRYIYNYSVEREDLFLSKTLEDLKTVIVGLLSNIPDINDESWWLRNLISACYEEFQWTQLHLAALNKNIDSIQNFITSPPTYESINVKDKYGYTPLLYAAATRERSKFIESIFYTLKTWGLNDKNQLYAIVNAKNSCDDSAPLHWVISNGDLNSAQVLLKNIQDIDFNQEQLFNILNSQDSIGFSTMECILDIKCNNKIGLLELLLKYMKSFKLCSQQYVEILLGRKCLLYTLIQKGFEREALCFLNGLEDLPLEESQRAEIVSQHNIERNNNTPLHEAAFEGYCCGIIVALLKNGAVFNAYNYYQKTPLDIFNEKNIGREKANYQNTKFLLQSIDRLFELVESEINQAPKKVEELKEILDKIKERTWIDPKSILNARNREGKTLLDLSSCQDVTDLLQGLTRE